MSTTFIDLIFNRFNAYSSDFMAQKPCIILLELQISCIFWIGPKQKSFAIIIFDILSEYSNKKTERKTKQYKIK